MLTDDDECLHLITFPAGIRPPSAAREPAESLALPAPAGQKPVAWRDPRHSLPTFTVPVAVLSHVIPAQAGIQGWQNNPGFRVAAARPPE
jgi:hypothetical protein